MRPVYPWTRARNVSAALPRVLGVLAERPGDGHASCDEEDERGCGYPM